MPQLTISAAARLCHMDRRTLQRAIHAGRLHLDAQHCLSTDELILAGYLIADTPHDAPHGTPQYTPQGMPQDAPLLPILERVADAMERLVQELHQLRTSLSQAPQAPPQGMASVLPQTAPQDSPQDMPHDTPQDIPQEAPQTTRTTRGALRQRKLTPRQQRALRDKYQRGVSVPALMDEYGISRASVFRYLQSPQR